MRRELWHYNAEQSAAVELTPGIYGVSNAGLDTPWPKLLKARAALTEVLDDPQPQALLALLGDPQTAAFRRSAGYRCGVGDRESVVECVYCKPELWHSGRVLH